MKVIVAGSRTLGRQSTVGFAIQNAFNKWMSEDKENWKKYYRPEIVSGGAKGVDFCGEVYAKQKGLDLTVFPADWETHGKKAGILRNMQMGDYADALIAVWDGSSPGTKHMIDYMTKLNKLVFIYETSSNP